MARRESPGHLVVGEVGFSIEPEKGCLVGPFTPCRWRWIANGYNIHSTGNLVREIWVIRGS